MPGRRAAAAADVRRRRARARLLAARPAKGVGRRRGHDKAARPGAPGWLAVRPTRPHVVRRWPRSRRVGWRSD